MNYIMLPFITLVFAANDVKANDWFYGSVHRLIEDERAIVVGYPDGSFRPQNKRARDQFITMVVRALGQDPGNAEEYWAQHYIDAVMGAFEYDENSPKEGRLEDFERLLQRRMPQDQVDIVMAYVEKKTGYHSYLDHDQAFFYLDNDRYLIRIDEVKLYDGSKNLRGAVAVNFNIWYRDQNFIDVYEKNITQIMPYTDVIIYE